MKTAIQWVRSLVFNIQMYVVMVPIGLFWMIPACFDRKYAVLACRSYCWYVQWSARWMVGITCEVRGDVPTDEVLIASKHQSFLDVLMIYGAIPSGKFIMKDILKYAPILGQFGLRVGCIPVKRGQRGAAIKKMLADVQAGRAAAGQLIIYSQGTRTAPGVKAPYKIGTAALYREMGQDCVPVACNVGLFWPKRGVIRTPGTAVVEFLPRIPTGVEQRAFMQQLENVIETRSNALMREAGFTAIEE